MRRILACFWKCEEGIAAVEFALSLPLIMTIFLGGFELSRFVQINFKAEKVAYTVADVVAQQTSITSNQITQIMSAASQIMKPYTFDSNGAIIVSSIYKSPGQNPVVSWQRQGGGTLNRASKIGLPGNPAVLPFGLTLNDKDNVIYAEVYYTYMPLISTTMFANKEGYKVAVFKPRLGALTTAPN